MIDQWRKQFEAPAAEFGPMPFWFWNDELSKEELIRQIREFHAKEVTGFVLHPRMGLPRSMPYMSEAYLELAEAAVAEAARLGMSVILYDEGMYPSGAANGLVVKQNPAFASRGLAMREFPCQAGPAVVPVGLEPDEELVSMLAYRKLPDGSVVPDSVTVLDWRAALSPGGGGGSVPFRAPDGDGWFAAVFVDTPSGGTIRGIHPGQDDGEPDAPRAADLLNEEAMRTFIALTHDAYYERLRDYFGGTVIAMFTDEPDLLGRRHKRGLRPWTRGFLAEYTAAGGGERDLPALWLEAGAGTAGIRGRFEDAVRARLTRTYYRPLAQWCEAHGIALTGHPAGSGDIGLLEHFHIPGQDVVWRWIAPEDGKALDGPHTVLAKCASDAARHRGRRRNLNECFGVCGKESGWALTADNMKWYLDWLFVRGTNLIVPHAFYYSIRGERRDERPPDVGPNNIWWPHYEQFARYIKRMSWLMTDGANTAEIAVLTGASEMPWSIAKPLFERQIEFNYLEEELLAASCTIEDGLIRIAGYAYKAVLIENTDAFKPEGLRLLAEFVSQGGAVIALPEAGRPGSEHAKSWRFVQRAEDIPAVLDELALAEPLLEPACAAVRISRVKKGGTLFYCIVNEGEDEYTGSLRIPAGCGAEIWQPWTGETFAARSPEAACGTSAAEQLADRSEAERNAGSPIALRLQRRECLIVAADPALAAPADSAAESGEFPKIIPLQLQWHVSGGPLSGGPRPALSSWAEWEGMEHFSGTLVYESRFDFPAEAVEAGGPEGGAPSVGGYRDGGGEAQIGSRPVRLDLGDTGEIARVAVNGRDAGVRMWKPYVFDVSPFLQAGANELRIEVTNSLANRYDGQRLPSGLLGPVTLQTGGG
ncbi:glycosyl hydrolase [Paenibacillus humicola]|uniref:glycosyl hydrolase n=1 Tax=Paenibacillus humicola TaxID=3110540 RepID=UPI00237A31E6|nr:glycosyl hydrolase [Paenibacillus humicola]